jgi:hypothetical protein
MKKQSFLLSVLIVVLILFALLFFFFSNKTIVFSKNFKQNIEKIVNQNIDIKEIKTFEVNQKKYILILSTQTNNNNYKYFNCYEEKMNGLYYKSCGGTEQGKSNNYFGLASINISDSNDFFSVVFGYNKGFQIASYEIQVDKENIKSNVSNKEYFIHAYKGHLPKIINAIDKDGKNRINVFND